MKTNDTSIRVLAMEWWYKLPRYDMDKPCKEIYSQRYYERQANSLTGREIEEIWVKEVFQKLTPSQADFVEKPNRKQFKEFSPELFKAYIDKFSADDKIKAMKILYDEHQEFKKFDKVKVVLDKHNASQFHNNGRGIYKIEDWATTVFEVAGEYIPVTFRLDSKCYGAYPLRLVGEYEIIGYIYNEAIEKI